MWKRLIVAAVVLTVIFGGVIGFKLYKQAMIRDYLANMGLPSVPLNATVADSLTWDHRLAAIGSLRAQAGVDIRSEVGGVIRRVHVGSRDAVQEGDLLVELDDAIEQATLKGARARLVKVQRDFQRDQSLFERGLISEDQFDGSRSEFESAAALVEQTEATIDKKALQAPFSGTVGIHNLAEGHYLEAGDIVVTLQALDKLYLDLNLSEKELENLSPGQRVIFRVPSHGEREFEGTIRFVDVVVQTTTRNVLVRAEVDNSHGLLLPGMFASATIVLDEARDVVVLPREAVAFSLYGETVFVLEPADDPDASSDWVARRQAVTTGEVRGDLIEVIGLEAGQIVARDTQHRLLEGTPVEIHNPEVLERLPGERGRESN